jgi:hypothetical protein
MADTLQDRIYDGKELTEDELNALVKMVGSGCRQATKDKLYWTLRHCPHLVNHGIYGRVVITPAMRYNAGGPGSTIELRTVRECLIGR